MGISSAVYYLR